MENVDFFSANLVLIKALWLLYVRFIFKKMDNSHCQEKRLKFVFLQFMQQQVSTQNLKYSVLSYHKLQCNSLYSSRAPRLSRAYCNSKMIVESFCCVVSFRETPCRDSCNQRDWRLQTFPEVSETLQLYCQGRKNLQRGLSSSIAV